MQVTNNPALPAHCVRCIMSVRDQYVDTEVQLDYYGAVLICVSCVIEMGQLVGMASPEQSQVLRNEIEGYARERFELKRQIAGLEAAVDGLASARKLPVSECGCSNIRSSDAQGQRDISSGASSDVPVSGTGLDRGAGTTSESSHDEHVAGLRSDVSSDAGGEFALNI